MKNKKYSDPFRALADSFRGKKELVKRFNDKEIIIPKKKSIKLDEETLDYISNKLGRGISDRIIVDMGANHDQYTQSFTIATYPTSDALTFSSTGTTISNFDTLTWSPGFHPGTTTERISSSIGSIIGQLEEPKKKKLSAAELYRKKIISANRNISEDHINSKKTKFFIKSLSIEVELLKCISNDKKFVSKTTEYNPETRELKLNGICIAKLTSTKEISKVYFPMLIDENLFRLRLRQVGLNCKAIKNKTKLIFYNKSITLKQGEEYNIPAEYREICLPSGLITKLCFIPTLTQEQFELGLEPRYYHQLINLRQLVSFPAHKNHSITMAIREHTPETSYVLLLIKAVDSSPLNVSENLTIEVNLEKVRLHDRLYLELNVDLLLKSIRSAVDRRSSGPQTTHRGAQNGFSNPANMQTTQTITTTTATQLGQQVRNNYVYNPTLRSIHGI